MLRLKYHETGFEKVEVLSFSFSFEPDSVFSSSFMLSSSEIRFSSRSLQHFSSFPCCPFLTKLTSFCRGLRCFEFKISLRLQFLEVFMEGTLICRDCSNLQIAEFLLGRITEQKLLSHSHSHLSLLNLQKCSAFHFQVSISHFQASVFQLESPWGPATKSVSEDTDLRNFKHLTNSFIDYLEKEFILQAFSYWIMSSSKDLELL